MESTIYIGILGILLGFISFLAFTYARICRLLRKDRVRQALFPDLLGSLRHLALIMVWIGVFGMVFFAGLFFRAFHVFTQEKAIAEIAIRPIPGDTHGPRSLVCFTLLPSSTTRYLLIHGDQWMIEGDFLKWHRWVRFLGFHTRYRLTRLRGRYLDLQRERDGPHSIHALSEGERHSLWRYLHSFGQHLPFVDTVYGNASYQDSRKAQKYVVHVGDTGFVVRKATEKPHPENEP